jgi:hypothetical protein
LATLVPDEVNQASFCERQCREAKTTRFASQDEIDHMTFVEMLGPRKKMHLIGNHFKARHIVVRIVVGGVLGRFSSDSWQTGPDIKVEDGMLDHSSL